MSKCDMKIGLILFYSCEFLDFCVPSKKLCKKDRKYTVYIDIACTYSVLIWGPAINETIQTISELPGPSL